MTTNQVAAASSPPRRLNWRIFLLSLGMFALGTDAFVVAGVLPVIAHDMHVSEGLAGQLVTIFSLTYGLGAPVLAALTGRFPRNQVLLVSLAAFCLVNICSALAPTFPLLLLTRLLVGCCAATYAPLAYAIGASLAPPEKQGQALALVVLGLTTATVLGTPLGTWIGTHFEWRYSFGLVAAIACIAVLALLLGGLPKSGQAPMLSLKTQLAPIHEPQLLLAMAPALIWNTASFLIYTYIATLLQHGLGITDVSGFLLVFGLGVVIGNLLGGFITAHFGAARPISIFIVSLALVFATLFLTSTSVPTTVIALFLWGILGMALFTPQQHRLLGLAPKHASVILALNNSTLYLGIAAGAAVGGVIVQAAPISWLGWTGAILSLVALVVFRISIRASARPRQEHSAEDVVSSFPTAEVEPLS